MNSRDIAERREAARDQMPPFAELPRHIKPCHGEACGLPFNSRRFKQCVFCDGQTYGHRSSA